MNLYEQQIEKLRKALQEGCKEATDYLAEGPFDADIEARLQIARNTAARATDVVVAARCAGRASVFETYLGELDVDAQEAAQEAAEELSESDAAEPSAAHGDNPIAGLVAGLWYGRPEAPNKPGKISIDVTSDEDRLPLLALGDVVELRKIEGSAPTKRRRSGKGGSERSSEQKGGKS